MTTITQTISAITPSDPRTMTRDAFSAAAPLTIIDIVDMVAEVNTWAGQANTVAGEVNTNAVNAAAAAVSAAAAQTAAEAAAGATIWVSGTSYVIGNVRWSPADYQSYRRITNGAGTTDPSLDATNWVRLGSSATTWTTITANPSPAIAGAAYACNTTSAAFTVTLPAAPAANDTVQIADYAGTFSTNNLTVGRNSLKIMGLSEDMVISTNNVSITLTYIDATQGWRLT